MQSIILLGYIFIFFVYVHICTRMCESTSARTCVWISEDILREMSFGPHGFWNEIWVSGPCCGALYAMSPLAGSFGKSDIPSDYRSGLCLRIGGS